MSDNKKIDYRQVLKNWNGQVEFTYEHLPLAALMSIRDELRTLNQTLACPNFLGMPHTLKAIQRNTTKRRRKK